jgi:hypothetical protein
VCDMGGQGWEKLMQDTFRDRVFDFLNATSERWATMTVDHSLGVALDLSGEGDPFEGANIDHLHMVVAEWFLEQGGCGYE